MAAASEMSWKYSNTKKCVSVIFHEVSSQDLLGWIILGAEPGRLHKKIKALCRREPRPRTAHARGEGLVRRTKGVCVCEHPSKYICSSFPPFLMLRWHTTQCPVPCLVKHTDVYCSLFHKSTDRGCHTFCYGCMVSCCIATL